jgi:hypothetical protein
MIDAWAAGVFHRRKLDYDTAYATEVIITMGCGDACPRVPRQ